MKKILLLFSIISILLTGCTNQATDKKIGQMQDEMKQIIEDNEELHDQINQLAKKIEEYESTMNHRNIDEIIYYISKLKDKEYTTTYGDEAEPSTWYIAAEELGKIGNPAIPYLIKNMKTNDTYEKGLTIYALLLASQCDNVDEFTGGEYIKVGLSFLPEYLTEYLTEYEEKVNEWWEKYKEYFE